MGPRDGLDTLEKDKAVVHAGSQTMISRSSSLVLRQWNVASQQLAHMFRIR